MFNKKEVTSIIQQALTEDIGPGDWTTLWLIPPGQKNRAAVVVGQSGIIAGLEIAGMFFEDHQFKTLVKDGSEVTKGQAVAEIFAPTRVILTKERTILNFMQRMSGIATLTRKFVEAVEGTGVVILDTRKTAPGLRILDKWAVRLGGGQNHRFGLFDMILVKDNHIKAAGSITKVVEKLKKPARGWSRPRADGPWAQALGRKNSKNLDIEIEVENLEQLKEALKLKVKRILLDNMSISQIRKAVRINGGQASLEVSGGVKLENVREIAKTGVDFISVGTITHSAPALDIGIEITNA